MFDPKEFAVENWRELAAAGFVLFVVAPIVGVNFGWVAILAFAATFFAVKAYRRRA